MKHDQSGLCGGLKFGKLIKGKYIYTCHECKIKNLCDQATPKTKVCVRCKLDLPIEDFSRSRGGSYQNSCIKCLSNSRKQNFKKVKSMSWVPQTTQHKKDVLFCIVIGSTLKVCNCQTNCTKKDLSLIHI